MSRRCSSVRNAAGTVPKSCGESLSPGTVHLALLPRSPLFLGSFAESAGKSKEPIWAQEKRSPNERPHSREDIGRDIVGSIEYRERSTGQTCRLTGSIVSTIQDTDEVIRSVRRLSVPHHPPAGRVRTWTGAHRRAEKLQYC